MYKQPKLSLLHCKLTLCIALSISLAILFASAPSAFAKPTDAQPGGNVADPVIRSVDIAKVAIVRIITIASGHITVNIPNSGNVNFPTSGNKGYQLQLSGTGAFITSKG